ncbi:hypothetical protein P4493_05165 [Bacillus thuringiensis]|jgi:hypothetical protein|uniref:Transmembrane protein n=1 Tax=Bacillus thuringiensis TaxID=1428 RepID=A0A0B5NPX9_BACTU|nr:MULTISPECIES: hypothetical protein [Bacillus]MEC2536143.1 hypothetical protein [Bacillus cereus]MED1153615.1 hypothetical protein [Bacillus paranthracis]AJG74148.1 hypothetical protein BF38_5729 [Bacillus thuringiensis]AJH02785.1 hypothetical protein AS86_6171 [Bacillus thuringiensis HD1002]EEM74205.1 hypothetical protein bthur0010_58650 [Bacillus thuringiensis serovar pondicheriensis BGSC 4BA1]
MEVVDGVNQEKVELHYAEDGDFFKGVYYASIISIHFYALVFGLIRLCFYN